MKGTLMFTLCPIILNAHCSAEDYLAAKHSHVRGFRNHYTPRSYCKQSVRQQKTISSRKAISWLRHICRPSGSMNLSCCSLQPFLANPCRFRVFGCGMLGFGFINSLCTGSPISPKFWNMQPKKPLIHGPVLPSLETHPRVPSSNL